MTDKDIFYVYAHVRKSDGRIFYIGKGKNRRAWESHQRSRWWRNVVERHGFEAVILQEDMEEDASLLLEMWIIAKLRHEGHELVNLTDGGKGKIGYRQTSKSIEKSRASHNPKPIYCCNGMRFDSAGHARYWLIENGHPKANVSNVRRCANGAYPRAYGYKWTFSEGVFHTRVTGSSYLTSVAVKFKNISGHEFFGNRREFCKKFNFPPCSGSITLLMKGEIEEYSGWRVIKDD